MGWQAEYCRSLIRRKLGFKARLAKCNADSATSYACEEMAGCRAMRRPQATEFSAMIETGVVVDTTMPDSIIAMNST